MAYRIALLIDPLEGESPVRDLIAWARGDPGIDLCALVAEAPLSRARERPARSRPQSLKDALSRRVFGAMTKLESKLLLRRGQGRPGRIVEDEGDGIARIELPGRLDADDRRGHQALAAVRGLECDAIVCCTRGAPGGAVERAARDGAVWIRFGGTEPAFVGAAGFREVAEGEPFTHFTIVRSLRGKDMVLFRGSVATDVFYTRHRAALYARSAHYLGKAIERLAAGALTNEGVAIKDSPPTPPSPGDSLRYIWRTIVRAVRKGARRALGKEWNFGVAVIFEPWTTAAWSEGAVLPAPPGSFLADPFTIVVEGRHYVFVEEFSFARRKGVISVFQVKPDGAERLGTVLEEPYHLSFPFLFRHQGTIYMVPEGNADGTIKLYSCDHFPDRWSLRKTLLSGVSAVDTMLFEHGGRWWMLTTIKGAGDAANNAELHAFHADGPLGEWTPHARNPVVMDAARGRNGGMLRGDDGTIYRVAQRSGFDAYGTGCAIYRIDQLSPDGYSESLVRDIYPTFFEGLCGNHHIHSEGGLTVYDFCRDERP